MCVANAERKPCMSLCNYSSSRMTENFDHSLLTGDPKETYYIGPIEDTSIAHLNQWPSEGMVFLCIHFIRNRYCILVCVGFVLHKLDLRCFSDKDTSELLPNWRPTMESLYWKLM